MGHPATGWVPVPREGVPFGCVPRQYPWGSAPRGPARPRAGARLSLEESRKKEHQGSALDPDFQAARSHSLDLAFVCIGMVAKCFVSIY